MDNSVDLMINIIDSIGDASNNLKEILSLSEASTNSPSAFIDSVHDVSDKLKHIEKDCLIGADGTKTAIYYYNEFIDTILSVRSALLSQVEERKQSQVQMNSMATVYDEENLISEIHVSMEDMFEISLDNITMTTLTDAKDYSALALVNRMEAESALLETLRQYTKLILKDVSEKILSCNSSIFQFRTEINEAEYIQMMMNNDVNSHSALLNLIDTVDHHCYLLETIKKTLIKIFQLYKELEHNYKVYATAVKSYTSFALESVFSTDNVIDL